MAEGILRQQIEESGKKAIVDSAGIYGYHAGEPPDERAVHVLKKNGIDISSLTARRFSVNDFDHFDKIYVMDVSNLMQVMALARSDDDKQKISMIMDEVIPESKRSVPDPYYGGLEGFDEVYSMLHEAASVIVQKL